VHLEVQTGQKRPKILQNQEHFVAVRNFNGVQNDRINKEETAERAQITPKNITEI